MQLNANVEALYDDKFRFYNDDILKDLILSGLSELAFLDLSAQQIARKDNIYVN